MGRAIAGHVPPLTISTLRWLLAAAVLFRSCAPSAARLAADPRALGVLVYLSLIGGALFGALQFVGLQLTTALNVSVMNSLAPLFIGAAGAVMFRDRLTGGQFVGIVISLARRAGDHHPARSGRADAPSFNIGDLLILLNMVLWGSIRPRCAGARRSIR